MPEGTDRTATPRFGAGFRSAHFDEIVATPGAVDWFEFVSETLIGVGGARRAMVDRLRADYLILLHGVGLGIAGSDALDAAHLRGLRELADSVEPAFVSDHLCWTGAWGQHSHDLLPIAYTPEVLDHVASRVTEVQERIGRCLLLENASAYVAFRGAQIDEGEFFAELCARTGCGMLLDINNLVVNAHNLGNDPQRLLAAIPVGAVGYLHLAGHAILPDVRIDTHDADVPAAVWELFEVAARRFPHAGVIVERDDQLPSFAALASEVARARDRQRDARAGAALPITASDRLLCVSDGAAIEAPSWRRLQRSFYERMIAAPGGGPAQGDDLAALLDDARPVRAARGMRVYSDAYPASLREALAFNFPALAKVVSAADFRALATAYLQRHPPQHREFVSLGAHFADFVRSHRFADDYGVERDVLAEVVALEQAQIEVANEADADGALGPDALAAIEPEQWEDARFAFAPALRIVAVTHDVLPVVTAALRGEDPARPVAWRGAYLVHRAKRRLHTEALEFDDAAVLAALVAGRSFAAACAVAGAGDEEERAARGVRALLFACARELLLRVDLAQAARQRG